jgi:hypothetical protein
MLKANEVSIHPNEGFDLGMMTTAYDVELDGSGPALVKLLNECPKESFELPPKLYERYGKPRQAILKYDGAKLFIEPC